MNKIWIYSLFIVSTLFAQPDFDEVKPYQIINADKVVSTRETNDEYITNLTGDVHFFYGETEFYADLAQIFEKQEAELNYLKSQTNPHFLFNTLNNIYSLARDKSDLTPESILRLSKILRFMLSKIFITQSF